MKNLSALLIAALVCSGCIEDRAPSEDADAMAAPEPEAPTAEPPAPEPPTAEPVIEPEPFPPDPPDPNPGPAIPEIREPERHRTLPEMCDDVRPPGPVDGDGDPGGECSSDDDCVDGVNGRCVHGRFTMCTYDECFSDADCANDQGGGVCECEGGWGSDANACLGGDCRRDLDCETGYCSPSYGDCGDYSGFVAYYCHTFEDDCIDDADCADLPGGYCAFQPQLGRWACSNSHCDGK